MEKNKNTNAEDKSPTKVIILGLAFVAFQGVLKWI